MYFFLCRTYLHVHISLTPAHVDTRPHVCTCMYTYVFFNVFIVYYTFLRYILPPHPALFLVLYFYKAPQIALVALTHTYTHTHTYTTHKRVHK